MRVVKCNAACIRNCFDLLQCRHMADLVIISNRLPVSARKVGKKIEIYPSSGGLATGLSGYTNRRGTKWIGWPGLPSDGLTKADKQLIADKLRAKHCYPVFLTRKQINEFYNGYSNSVLWPLAHDLVVRTGDNERNWQAYQNVNRMYADAAIALSNPGDTVWVHDYQLLLAPQYLRTERPEDHIGFFMHIPFPPPDIFTAHKHAGALLAGLLGADLVGFHTGSYAANFLQNCRQLELGTVTSDQVVLPTRSVRVTDFPLGIDYFKFAHASRQLGVREERRKLERKYRGMQVIATVDRLDPAKGLVERVKAYEKVLGDNPTLLGKVVMVMLVIPSREDIAEYQRLKQRLEKLVRRINGQYGTDTWQPIKYMYRTMPFEELAALYQRADIAFIAPIRDGMNLVAKEYLASQQHRGGVLVLSKTAGAAAELKEAIRVDPAKPNTLVSGLNKALTSPRAELHKRTYRHAPLPAAFYRAALGGYVHERAAAAAERQPIPHLSAERHKETAAGERLPRREAPPAVARLRRGAALVRARIRQRPSRPASSLPCSDVWAGTKATMS